MRFLNFLDISLPARGFFALAGLLLLVAAVSAQQNPAFLTIAKAVNTINGEGDAITPFQFTASANFGVTSFTLIDNIPGPGGVSILSIPITNFGVGNEVIINEENTVNWSLADITCSINDRASVIVNTIFVQPAPLAGTVSIRMQPGGVATCTFTNTQLAPTAAPAAVSGRVLSASGLPLMGVSLVLTDANTGETRYARSNTFGYFVFENCVTEDFYVLRVVSSKRYTFPSDTRSFTLLDNVVDMDFTADP